MPAKNLSESGAMPTAKKPEFDYIGGQRVERGSKIEFFAGRRFKIDRGGELVFVTAGDPVPEAADFPALNSSIRVGKIICLVDGKPIRRSRKQARRLGWIPRGRAGETEKAEIPGSDEIPVPDEVPGSAESQEDSGALGGGPGPSKTTGRPRKASKKKASKKKAPKKKGSRTGRWN